jgi:hypothetical protein
VSAGRDHSHAPASFNRAFALGIGLNIAFVVVEAFYGWRSTRWRCWPMPGTVHRAV